jgi:hypothetical protein
MECRTTCLGTWEEMPYRISSIFGPSISTLGDELVINRSFEEGSWFLKKEFHVQAWLWPTGGLAHFATHP